MAYSLKSTGPATKLALCVLVDDDGATIVDLCGSTVTPHANVTIHDAVWKGVNCKAFRTPSGGTYTPNGINLDQGGGTYPATSNGKTPHGMAAMVIMAGSSAGTAGTSGTRRPFIKMTGGTNIGLVRFGATGGVSLIPSGGAGASLPPVGTTPLPTDNSTPFSAAGNFCYLNPSSQAFYGLGSGSLAADSAAVDDVSVGDFPAGVSIRYIGGEPGQVSHDGYYIMALVFTEQLTLSEFQSIHNDPFGTLIEAGGSTPVSFSGTIPTQNATEGTPFSVDLSSYFSGTETPFTYSIQSGALPDGLSLNAGTGVISGTPTTVEVQSGLVVRGTDDASNTDDTNSFSITVAAAHTEVLGVRIQLFDGSTEQANLTGLTVAWFDDPDPATFTSPVYQSNTATTDANGWLEIDIDGDTMLDIDDPGFLIVYKADAEPEDDLVFAGRRVVEDIG